MSKRNPVTEEYWPDKMTLDQFILRILCNNPEVFRMNMEHLGIDKKEKYPEDWTKMWVAWMELNQAEEPDMRTFGDRLFEK